MLKTNWGKPSATEAAADAEGAPAEEEWGADEDEEREEPASVDERLGAAESEDDMVSFSTTLVLGLVTVVSSPKIG